MNKEELKQEIDKKEEVIDALSTALKHNKDQVKRLKAENETLREELKGRNQLVQKTKSNTEDIKKAKEEHDRLRKELKRRDDLQKQMQTEIGELKIQNEKERAKTQRYQDLEFGSESFNSHERNRDFELGSESLRSYERHNTTHQDVESCRIIRQRRQQLYRGLQNDKTYLAVAAIDVCSTHSSYAISFRSDPSEFTSHTVPSTILLNKNKEFDAFGDTAELKYRELRLDEEHEKYYYFRRFNALLFGVSVAENRRDITLIDDFNKKVSARTIFSMAIKYLIDHLMKLRLEVYDIRVTYIRWVLMVHAVWTSDADELMRQAAIECSTQSFLVRLQMTHDAMAKVATDYAIWTQAGIGSEDLIVVLEPDAAMTYCMTNLHEDKLEYFGGCHRDRGSVFRNRTKHILVDAGELLLCDDEIPESPVTCYRENDVKLFKCVSDEDQRITLHDICVNVDMNYLTVGQIVRRKRQNISKKCICPGSCDIGFVLRPAVSLFNRNDVNVIYI